MSYDSFCEHILKNVSQSKLHKIPLSSLEVLHKDWASKTKTSSPAEKTAMEEILKETGKTNWPRVLHAKASSIVQCRDLRKLRIVFYKSCCSKSPMYGKVVEFNECVDDIFQLVSEIMCALDTQSTQ